MITPVDASYLADAVILLRYFEAKGEVRQAISVMKKRGGRHERTIREFRLDDGRITVGEPLREFRGVLTGVPVYEGRTRPLAGRPMRMSRTTLARSTRAAAPGADDARTRPTTQALLRARRHRRSRSCAHLRGAARTSCDAGAAAVLIPEEAVVATGNAAARRACWREQPPWSDLPVLVLTRPGADSPALGEAVRTLGNVTLLERPVRVATLLSAVRTALRARERQYQIRGHLAERARAEEALRVADQRKDEFLATLGHELRNPLAPLLTALASAARRRHRRIRRRCASAT